ncbi:FAD-dependent monooxygenase [Lentzea sp. NPDC060358]|uniref:FAD-dependent monooxygenase n=1 Tax=Lentzea sp. NPDC060358 TaxID=3347103 RepID=UPI0036589EE4
MTTRHAVVSGASIAGLSAAFWLRRTGWEVTVLERAESFRDGGQNVDVRGTAREVLARMGLTEAVRAQNTTETGTVFVDSAGRVLAELPSDGPDGATAELEVLRGDFARTILDNLPGGVEMVYGDTIAEVDEGSEDTDVTITTASGRTLRADLLVIAEGVRSSTRDLLFGGLVDRRDLGIAIVFGTIPRTADDDRRWRWYTTTGGRQVHLRPDNHGTTRAMLACTGDLGDLGRAEALRHFRDRFTDAGWESRRVLDGFDGSADVYVDQLTQIRMPTWHRGRVCLVGDAAWCVTPLGGGGASLALVSGYVLAAQLSTSPEAETALAAYEEWLRPLVDDVQNFPGWMVPFAYPRTALGLRLRRVADKVMTSRLLAPLTAKITQVAASDRALPPITARA